MDARLIMRVVFPTIGIGVLLLTMGLLAGWYVHRLQREASAVLQVNVASARAAARLEINIRKVQTLLYQFRVTKNPVYLQQIPPLNAEASEQMAAAERLATTSREREVLARARAGFDSYLSAFEAVKGSEATDPADRLGARGIIDGLIQDVILPPVHEYVQLNEAAASSALQETQTVADRLVPALIILGLCGCTAGLINGFAFARGFARSLVQLSIPVRTAAGELGQVVGPITFSPVARVADLESVLHRLANEVGTVVERLQVAEHEVARREQLAALGQLAAGLAHEMRNPLTAIRVLVQKAIRLPHEQVLGGQNLAVVHAEIERIQKTIQAFLDFARPSQPEKRRVDVGAIIRDKLALVSARSEQQGVTIRPVVPNSPVIVEADPAQLRQLLLNLLINALEATPRGGVVEIRVREEPEWIEVEVADTGRGLPAELEERIFDPFVSTKETGTGLGLSICKRVVDCHGGSIIGVNRPGRGAAFTVRLPVNGVAL